AHAGRVHGVAFSPDGEQIASASTDGFVKLWRVQTSEVLLTVPRSWSDDNVPCGTVLAFRPDGQQLATAGGNYDFTPGDIQLWDIRSGKEVFTLRGHTALVTCVAFSPDGQRLVSGSNDHTVKLWNVATGE